MTNYIIVLCSDCKEVPLIARPTFGDARGWDGMLICMPCANRRRQAMWGGIPVSEVQQ